MTANRLKLITLGGISIQAEDAAGLSPAATRRQPLGLLAVVAVSGSVGITRDRICAIFWPESDTEHARNALKQMIFSLRRDLKQPDLFVGTTELRLNPEVIYSDVAEFTAAIQSRDFARAIALYTGPFLEGVHLRNAPEFESWAEAERSKLAEQADSAMRTTARAASAAGDHDLATSLWRRVLALQPLDSVATLEMMRALELRGDRPGALRQAELHTANLRKELDADPDPRVVALANEIASQMSLGNSASRAPSHKHRSGHSEIQSVSIPPQGAATSLLGGSPAADRTRNRRVIMVGIITFLAAGGIWFAVHGANRESRRIASLPPSVFIAPFRVGRNEPSLLFLHEGMVDLLSSTLSGDSTNPRIIDPSAVFASLEDSTGSHAVDPGMTQILHAAERTGASLIVSGSVENARDKILVNASLYNASTRERLGDARASGSLDSLPRLVDHLAAQLMAIEMGEGEFVPDLLSGTPLPAVRSYLEGRAAFRRGAYEDAVRFQKRALLLDSTFALAALELGRTAGWLGNDADRHMAYTLAWANMAKLRPLDRTLILAMLGPGYPDGPTRTGWLSAWEHITDIRPEEPEGWYEVGDLLFHNPWLGTVSDQEGLSRARLLFSRALDRAPDYLPALQHLLQLEAHNGDTATVRRLEAAARKIRPGSDLDRYLEWRTAVALSDPIAQRLAWSRFQPANSLALQWLAMSSEEDGIPLDDAERALQERLRTASTDQERLDALLSIHALAMNRGELKAASQAAAALRTTQPTLSIGPDLQILDAVYGGAPVDSGVLSAVDGMEKAVYPTAKQAADDRDRWSTDRCILGHWYIAREETAKAESTAEMLEKIRDTHSHEPWSEQVLTCTQLLRAFVALHEHKREASDLVKAFDRRMATGPYMTSRLLWDISVIGSARLFELNRDYAGAQKAIRRRNWFYRWPHYLARQVYDLGRFAALNGDRDEARVAYKHYLQLRTRPDPALASEFSKARAAYADLAKAP